MLSFLEKFPNLIPISNNSSSISYTRQSFAIASQEVVQSKDAIFSYVDMANSTFVIDVNSMNKSNASISIPSSVLDGITPVRVSHNIFVNDKLFRSDSRTLWSVIIATSVSGHTFTDLKEPVQITFSSHKVL